MWFDEVSIWYPCAGPPMTDRSPSPLVDLAVALGVVEMLGAAAAISGRVIDMYEDIGDAPYRLREVALVGGEALAGGAIALALLAARGRVGGLALAASARLVTAAICLGGVFARGWYFFLDPVRGEAGAWVVFLAGVAQTLVVVAVVVMALRGREGAV